MAGHRFMSVQHNYFLLQYGSLKKEQWLVRGFEYQSNVLAQNPERAKGTTGRCETSVPQSFYTCHTVVRQTGECCGNVA